MNFVLCEDDSALRAVLGALVEERGHTVVGEADSAFGAGQLVERVRPDGVITDLALLTGSGLEVLRAAEAQNCHTIVYSAYCDDIDLSAFTNRPIGIEKPHFDRLEAAIDALSHRHEESGAAGDFSERRDTNAARAAAAKTHLVAAIEEPHDFYLALAEACQGDALVAIDTGAETDTEEMGVLVRLLVRAQDHIMQRDRRLIVLLIGGSPQAASSVADRVRREATKRSDRPAPSIKTVMIEADEAPSDAYTRLTELGPS